MRIVHDRAGLAEALARQPAPLALVPTMGNLHAGHLSLVARARAEAGDGTVVASLFVNPTQFGPDEDYECYPRTFEADRDALEAAGVDLLFAPTVEEIYPFGAAAAVQVRVPALADTLCGEARPGHFDGVATVVTRLFTLVRPDLAVFGRKDYQQVLIIERLSADLGLGVRIVPVDTLREADGLAMSSRNGYLSAADRARAPALHQALRAIRDAIRSGLSSAEALATGRRLLSDAGIVPEYLELRRAADLAPPVPADRTLVVLVAAPVGAARLIDNLLIDR